MYKLLTSLFLFCFATMVNAQFLRPEEVDKLDRKKADYVIDYGDDALQFAHLRLPKNQSKKPHKVVVIIHGGCWYSPYADLNNTEALADALRDEGYATYNIEYRRFDNPGGGWPNTLLDCAKALDYLRIIGDKYNLDTTEVVTYGHSAGGHLALWLAARHKLSTGDELFINSPLAVKGVLGVGAIADLEEFEKIDTQTCGEVVVRKLMGGYKADFPKRYAQASPIELLPLGVNQILITGEQDNIVPMRLGNDYTKKANAAGDKISHIIIKNSAHHEYNAPNAAPWKEILKSLDKLFN